MLLLLLRLAVLRQLLLGPMMLSALLLLLRLTVLLQLLLGLLLMQTASAAEP